MAAATWPGIRRRLVALIEAARPDIVVSTHPLLTWSVAHAVRELGRRVPFAVVVTDLVTGHASWYERAADLVCVPTQASLDRALALGVEANKVRLTGQPVQPKAAAAVRDRDALRARFGWNEPWSSAWRRRRHGQPGCARRRAGHGATARAHRGRLRPQRGAARPTRGDGLETPVEVFGFVDNLHEMMAAADILVTKGGPGSVIEGCLAGLPVLIYDYIPGQEIGNVDLVRSAGIGDLVRDPAALPAAVRRFLDDPAARARASAAGRALAVPDSADRIARAVLALR